MLVAGSLAENDFLSLLLTLTEELISYVSLDHLYLKLDVPKSHKEIQVSNELIQCVSTLLPFV